MTGLTDDGIEIEREIAAAPDSVFAALTTPDSFSRWFGGASVQVPLETLDYHAEAGRTWAAKMVLPDQNTIDWTGEFLEVTSPSRVAMSITDQPGDKNRASLTFDLNPNARGTTLLMSQQTPGFTPEQKDATIAGWQTFLDVLTGIAEA